MFIITRTPVRISFFGGGTDYPAFFEEHGGAVLGTTINHYIHISIKTLKSVFFDYKIRLAYSKIEMARTIDEIEHPSVRESLRHLDYSDALDIHVFSDLPARTGLGSSSSFTVGLLKALLALKNTTLSPPDLAQLACHIEQKKILEAVGCQDHYHAAWGGFNVLNFSRGCVMKRQVQFRAGVKQALEESLLGFYTGVTRDAYVFAQEKIDRIRQGATLSVLKHMKEMVHEGERIVRELEGEAALKTFGALLHEGWLLKKNLASKVTNSFIDQAYEEACKAGAWGGKLCGAGGGGFLIFVAPKEKHPFIRAALKALPEVEFRFENEGAKIIYQKE